ncbi:cyanate transporter [Kocuria dechangensis]|uniref:Cyanate transporter n=1 Tax=Kocuria dechangensis TaxID=1176249 RepID=A0A917GJC1_9MICC|nr:MFS transporter [Kocuria dechangensis]GGG48043.1 cyanate transporter [Kocuria dechangensis]
MLIDTSAAPRPWLRPALGWVGVVLVAVNLRVGFVTVGPLLEEISRDLGISAGQAGLLTGLPLAMFALFSPVAPAVAARTGLDRALWLSLLLLAAGILGRSAPVEGAVWAGTAVVGIGIAFLNVLVPSLVKREFPLRVSQVTGVYTAVQGAVAAAGSALVVPIAHAGPGGWRLALVVWAALAVVALVVLSPWVRRRAAPPGPHDEEPRPVRSPWRSALGWQVTLFMGLQSVAFYVLMAWLPSIEQSHGVSATAAGTHMALFLVVGMTASLATGSLLGRFRDQRPVALAGSVLALVTFAGLAAAPGLMLLWILLGAVGCGSLIVVALSLFSLRSGDHRQAAALSGMAQSVGYALAAAGPAVFGALYDAGGRWELPLVVTAGLMLALCGFSLGVGRDRVIGRAP